MKGRVTRSQNITISGRKKNQFNDAALENNPNKANNFNKLLYQSIGQNDFKKIEFNSEFVGIRRSH